MPIDLEPTPAGTAVTAAASAVIELSSLVCTCTSTKKTPRIEIPAALVDRVTRFWGDDWPALGEIVVLAHATGSLTDLEVDDFLERLKDPPPFAMRPPLETETAPERDAIHARLDRFVADRRLRLRYSRLMADLWAFFAPRWRDGGRARAQAAAAAWQARLDAGADPLDLLPGGHIAARESFPAMTHEAWRRGELLMTPVVGGHGHIVALPGVLSVAGPASEPDPAVERRRGADEIAELLRVLSDPTRLTILSQLATQPLAVSDLARTLHIAQPTASVHLRRLREAGLVSAERRGARSVYSARPEAVETLMADVTERLSRSLGL